MDTLLFLLFCLAIGYVIVWVVLNERRGNKNGEWGIIAMRVAPEEPKRPSDDAEVDHHDPRGFRNQSRPDRSVRAR